MKKTLLLFVWIFASGNLFGQILMPVKWSYAAKKINDKEAILFIKATIDEGWHIYSVNQPDGGPVKTSFTFFPSKEYNLIDKLMEPKPQVKYENNFKIDVRYFEKSVVFQQKVKVKTKHTTISGKLNFMVCNEEKCLPPEDIIFKIPIKN